MIQSANQPLSVTAVIQGATDLRGMILNRSGYGPVTPDAADEQRESVRDALTELRKTISAFLEDS
jgi:hypothetical protein